MRYFVPQLRPAWADPSPPRAEHFGGLPVGFPAERWPCCAACGGLQTFLVQLVHHPDRLDLGKEGRRLYLFQCNHQPGLCGTWEADRGSNAALVLEPEEIIGEGATEPPGNCEREAHVTIDGWDEKDDGIAPGRLEEFFDEFWLEDTEDVREQVETGTKLGSAPGWMQFPERPLGDGWKFVGQLCASHYFPPPAPSADDLGCAVFHQRDGWSRTHEPGTRHPAAPKTVVAFEGDQGWAIHAANYGGSGTAYLFVRLSGPRPEARMLSQC